MSVVACKVTKDKIYLAADSRISRGKYIAPGLKFKKIRKVEGLIVAMTGTCSEGDLFIRYIEENEFPYRAKDIPTFMSDFYAYRDTVHAKLAPKGEDELSECNFIVVLNGNAYFISGLTVFKIKKEFAIGSGDDFASGALSKGATVQEAVEITCRHCSECGPPIQYVEIKRRKHGKR
jgi:ATP-dependent protease HslVU (ClpYQ) peptidase subunit